MGDRSDKSFNWWRRWLVLPLLALNGWVVLQGLRFLEPFGSALIVAGVLAFVLNAPVSWLVGRGVPRGFSLLLLLAALGTTALLLGVWFVPVIVRQAQELAALLPSWVAAAGEALTAVQHWLVARQLPIDVSQWQTQLSDRVPQAINEFWDETLAATLDVVQSASWVLLTLILTMYLVLDGARLWQQFGTRWAQTNATWPHTLRQSFRNYYLGQATIALLTAIVLAVLFSLLQVPAGIVLGLVIGTFTLIPFGDVVCFTVISGLLLVQNWTLGLKVLGVCLVTDQLMDQLVAPRVVGNLTGLPPIGVILALVLGTKVLGLPGLLVAVPLASFLNAWLLAPTEGLPRTAAATTPAPTIERLATEDR